MAFRGAIGDAGTRRLARLHPEPLNAHPIRALLGLWRELGIFQEKQNVAAIMALDLLIRVSSAESAAPFQVILKAQHQDLVPVVLEAKQ